jgi:hypothetical protein
MIDDFTFPIKWIKHPISPTGKKITTLSPNVKLTNYWVVAYEMSVKIQANLFKTNNYPGKFGIRAHFPTHQN